MFDDVWYNKKTYKICHLIARVNYVNERIVSNVNEQMGHMSN